MLRKPGERGQTLLMITFAMMALCGLLGLVVDVGYLYFRRHAARAAAESAALAAAEAAMTVAGSGTFNCGADSKHGVTCQSTPAPCPNPIPNPPTTVVENGCLYAQTNGFAVGGNSGRQSVSMAANTTSTPDTVPNVSVNYWVTARVNEQVPQLFSAVLGNTWGNVSARATAAVIGSAASGGPCLYAMNSSTNNAFVASGSATVNATCGISVNSNGKQAMVVSGGACVTSSIINMVGTLVSDGCVTPTKPTAVTSVSDPLSSLTPPSFDGHCDHTKYTLSGGSDTLSPGTYCDGITISGSSTATFSSGVYIILGGGFTASSSTVTVTGSKVSFYITGNSTYAYKPVTISGGTSVTLTPPDSGSPQAGVLFFKDRSIVSSSKNAISGGSSAQISGDVYFLNAPLVYSGGSSTNVNNVEIVADTLEFSGPSWIAAPSSGGGGSSGYSVAVVE